MIFIIAHCNALCNKFVGDKQEVESHMKKHSFYEKFKKVEKNAKEEGLKESSLDVHIKPLKFFLRTWKTTSCQFCGDKIKIKDQRQPSRHYRKCKMNPLPPFQYFHCSVMLQKYDELEAHLRSHEQEEIRKERDFEFKCPHAGCGQSFRDACNRNRHAKHSCTEKPNSSKRFVCEICKKDYSRLEHLRRHKVAKHKIFLLN